MGNHSSHWREIDVNNSFDEIPALTKHASCMVGTKLFVYGGLNLSAQNKVFWILDCTLISQK